MNYFEQAKVKGIRLELSPHDGRCWRKFHGGKRHYFSHPLTKEGYAAAIEEWYLLKAKLSTERPHAKTYIHNRETFAQVLDYFNAFGTPVAEREIHASAKGYLDFVESALLEPKLGPRISGLGVFLKENPLFAAEFVPGKYTALGTEHYELPDKWKDRIARMKPGKADKVPQTIGHWLDVYLASVERRVGRTIVEPTFTNRRHKLAHFKGWADLQAHISTIDDKYIDRYHAAVDGPDEVAAVSVPQLEKASKEGYFASFRMFVRWCGRASDCDLTPPANLDSREFAFREPKGTGRKRMKKKKLLWTKDEFSQALALPLPYRCYLLLMLNCGFRHVDLADLRHDDVDFDAARIIYQRKKLNQSATTPVICYPLWPSTVEAMRQCQSDDEEYFFRNAVGESVENAIKLWWRRYAQKHGLGGKRLDFLRKTGSTSVARFDRGLDEFYLGEALDRTAKQAYSFNDGEPCDKLDKAIQNLGWEFGQAEQPTVTVELTPELIQALKKLGHTVG